MPCARSAGSRRPGERGSAVVDFVLVLVVLLPLLLGILHLALVLHVRNTLTAAASDGARHAATADRAPGDGAARTRELIAGALSERFAQRVTAAPTVIDGAAAVVVTVRAEVPPLGLWGPAVALSVTGHATEERP
ncbi:TadE/TadG family type IV pilus assembly protein [Nocardioides donggukensis]|uniref:Pilus assembly protein n=1 Tax=Nocardioides donggukensis TaxID=2774019 RepID=A0A927K6U1_9ACTN|nr:TadE/TadG family type IV pilus assembly protein [Nocardioides donggukensis]MBD8868765.1 pilus assembly protein [Nocardioides donggukensis]